MTVKITAKFDGNLVRPQGSDRFLLFRVMGDAAPKTDRAPLNVSLILDRSGSMAGEKLKLVKEAACFVVERLGDNDRVNVVAYDDEIRIVAKSVKASKGNRKEISKAIEKINSGGSTNLGEGWLTGCREIAEHQTEARYIDTAWLLTDGLANVGIVSQEELTNHATELRKRGINTTTFGVGTDFNEDLLRAMSEKGGGNFYFIESSRQIKNYFEGELGEKLNTVARNLILRVTVPEEVKLENLNEYEVSRRGIHTNIHLGDIYAGEEKLVLLKISVPAAKNREREFAFEAMLTFTEAINGAGREMRVNDPMTLRYGSDTECDAQKLDAEISELAVKLMAAHAKQRILAENRVGNYAAAAQVSADFKAAVQSSALPMAAPATQAEFDEVDKLAEQAAAPMAPAAAKAAFYGTHMAQRSRKDYKKED